MSQVQPQPGFSRQNPPGQGCGGTVNGDGGIESPAAGKPPIGGRMQRVAREDADFVPGKARLDAATGCSALST